MAACIRHRVEVALMKFPSVVRSSELLVASDKFAEGNNRRVIQFEFLK